MNQQQLEQKAKEAYPKKHLYIGLARIDITEESRAAFIVGASWMQGEGERQWISVKDRLPYKDGDSQIFCIVWDTREGIAVLPYNEYHKCWDGEDADDFYTDATDGNISHWMPLPLNPKQSSHE